MENLSCGTYHGKYSCASGVGFNGFTFTAVPLDEQFEHNVTVRNQNGAQDSIVPLRIFSITPTWIS